MLNDKGEEVLDETVEETEDEPKPGNEDFLTKPVDQMTTGDAEALRKYALTQKAQKEHFRKKANAPKEEAKQNLTQLKQEQTIQPSVDLTEELDVRWLKKVDKISDEDLDQLRFIKAGLKATGKDVTLMEAQDNPLYKAYQEQKFSELKRQKAQLISNNTPEDDDKSTKEREVNREDKAKEILSQM